MNNQIENEINSLFEEIETLCSQHTEVNPLITELTDIPIVKKVRAPRRPKEVIQAEKEAKALKAGAKLQAKTAEETYKAMRVPSQWFQVTDSDLLNEHLWSTFLCLNHTGDNGGMTPFPLENIENNGRIKHWIGNFDRLEDKQKYRAMVIQDDDGVLLK